MPLCKFCGVMFVWGKNADKFVPLVPIGEDESLERSYQDENGVLRAQHSLICVGHTALVSVVKLAVAIPAEQIIGSPQMMVGPPKPKRKRRMLNRKVGYEG